MQMVVATVRRHHMGSQMKNGQMEMQVCVLNDVFSKKWGWEWEAMQNEKNNVSDADVSR